MADSATQKLECDLVMRGGITSGIVYPRAIAKLAETYQFRAIGGTSAGAIAAAATAAAAYGARHGEDRFQTDIKDLPKDFGTPLRGKTRLERLFQPQAGTARIFRVLMASLGHKTARAMIFAIGKMFLGIYWFRATIVAVLVFGAFLGSAHWLSFEAAGFWSFLVLGLVLAVIFAVSAALVRALRDVLVEIPKNSYGLCSGSSNNVPDEAGVLPLTDWLNEYLQTLAGKKRDEPPLTFGELWGARDETAKRDIELVLMTTNVTRGISQRFPFLEGSWGQLFFRREDFLQLFPTSVVEHMCECETETRHADAVDTEGFYPLPAPADLPVLLGARMSLSFPFLLSAVPLYATNFEAKKTRTGKFPLERCWFSDGGLTSNFPIHLFDTPLPKRPTFGINLIPHDVEASEVVEDEKKTLTRVGGVGIGGVQDEKVPKEWKMIWMPSRNASGIGSAARFNKFEGENNEKPSVAGFFFALFDTARNWGDTELLALPGYKERVVHVKLASDEGGMNLKMDPERIKRVSDRGEMAGELLVARYLPTPSGDETLTDPQTREPVQLTWDNHRWIRYRATMAAFEDLARRFRSTWQETAKSVPWRAYDALVDRGEKKPKSYPFGTNAQRNFAIDATHQLVDFVVTWQTSDETFDRGTASSQGRSPRPKPTLRMMPPGSNDPRAERPD